MKRSQILVFALFCVAFSLSFFVANAQRTYWNREGVYENEFYYRDAPESQSLEMAIRYLKLGNTYREGRKYNLAQSYLRYGLDIAQARGSTYWEAVANEYAGLLFRDMGDRATSLDYLRRADYLYRLVLSPMRSETSVDAVRGIMRDIQLDYAYYRPSRVNYDYYGNYSYEYQTENQRLRDVNRALQLRINDLESRIRSLEMPYTGR